MFFRQSKENTVGFANGLMDLGGRFYARYFGFLKDIWNRDKKQALMIVGGLFLLFIFSFWICGLVFNSSNLDSKPAPRSNINSIQPNQTKVTPKDDLIQPKQDQPKFQQLVYTSQTEPEFFQVQQQTQEEKKPVEGVVGDQTYKTIDVLKGIVGGFKPMLESFVSNTPDVAGVSANEISFSSGKFPTAREFSNKLLQLLIPIYMVFIALEGINLIRNANSKNQPSLNQILWRHIICILMLIITPYILSYSIRIVNGFSVYMMDGKDLTSFLNDFLSKIQEGYKKSDDNALTNITNGISAVGNPFGTFIDGLQAVLAMIPIFLIALLYILVLGQFIIRFIKLYFLAAIYPLIAIFYGAPFEQNYTKSYWDSWIKTLLHQAFFIFGYAIVQKFLLQMLQGGSVGMEQIAIFIGSLLFLYNINTFTGEVLGGVISRGGNMINSLIGDVVGGAVGAAGMAGLFGGRAVATAGASQNKGFDMSQGTIGNAEAKSSGFQGFKGGASSKPKQGGQSSPSSQNSSASSNLTLYDPTQSKQAKSFSNSDFGVSTFDPSEGVISVKGKFFAHDLPGGVTNLYNSREDALDDRVPTNEVYQVNDQFNVQDTTNYSGRENYERRTGVDLGVNASDQDMKENLNQAKYDNYDKGIDGITTTQVSRGRMRRMQQTGEKISEDTPRIQKTMVYTNLTKDN